ncbi:MAG: hypothetical protein EGR79_04385 [Ruminococcaceae bacterium]|nr:hypothetical protein [Oscillospiraceae bacterium]
MKNPIDYFKDSFKSVGNIQNEILSKKQEIDTCKKQLDEIMFEKDSTSFKWYDVKNKTNFNEEIKAEKKLLKAKISKLEKEIKVLEKQKEAETDKRNKLFLLSGIVAFVIVCVIAITVGSINEKIHPEPQTTTKVIETTIVNTDKPITEPTTANTAEATTTTTETTTKETTEKATKETTEKTTKETTESTTSRSKKIVYGSRTGNHYHLADCRYANGAKMTVAEAERKGWEPCAVCNP